MFIKKYKSFLLRLESRILHDEEFKDLITKEIYGHIIVLSLLFYLLQSENSAVATAFKLFGTVISLGFAEAYAEFIGTHLCAKRPVNKDEIKVILKKVLQITVTSIVPCLLIFIAKTGIYSLNLAFILSISYSLLLLLFYLYICAELSQFTFKGKIIFPAMALFVGIMAVLFKYLMHL